MYRIICIAERLSNSTIPSTMAASSGYNSGMTKLVSDSQFPVNGDSLSGRAVPPPTTSTAPRERGWPPNPQDPPSENGADNELSEFPGVLYSAGRACNDRTLNRNDGRTAAATGYSASGDAETAAATRRCR